MKNPFLFLCLLTGSLCSAKAQPGPWDLNGTSVQTTTSFAVGIGISQPLEKFHLADGNLLISKNGVNHFYVTSEGLLRAREIKVDLDVIPDYVFQPDYCLMNLYQLEQYIQLNKHLPGIPSAAEYATEGSIDVGQLQLKLLEKVEELTLYLIALQRENKQLKQRLEALEAEYCH